LIAGLNGRCGNFGRFPFWVDGDRIAGRKSLVKRFVEPFVERLHVMVGGRLSR
jgi:hypothetical protein